VFEVDLPVNIARKKARDRSDAHVGSLGALGL
jgi:hypothetical protein